MYDISFVYSVFIQINFNWIDQFSIDLCFFLSWHILNHDYVKTFISLISSSNQFRDYVKTVVNRLYYRGHVISKRNVSHLKITYFFPWYFILHRWNYSILKRFTSFLKVRYSVRQIVMKIRGTPWKKPSIKNCHSSIFLLMNQTNLIKILQKIMKSCKYLTDVQHKIHKYRS